MGKRKIEDESFEFSNQRAKVRREVLYRAPTLNPTIPESRQGKMELVDRLWSEIMILGKRIQEISATESTQTLLPEIVDTRLEVSQIKDRLWELKVLYDRVVLQLRSC